MPLGEYRAKRDFKKTGEPSGVRRMKPHKLPIFVVQEHHASHLHYDFRLEADGMLKSWAVPKEPTIDPAVKRLAVQVEDHPIGYATFEGTIPQGQYGGGTVKIWDHGTYESLMEQKAQPRTAAEAIKEGHIEFVMHGKRLKGKFALIRMKPRGKGKHRWILIKVNDKFAVSGRAMHDNGKNGEKTGGSPSAVRSRSVESPARRTQPGKCLPKVALTHPDRIFFPEPGVTKRDISCVPFPARQSHLCTENRPTAARVRRKHDALAGSNPLPAAVGRLEDRSV